MALLLAGLPRRSAVKNLPATQETRVQSLGWEDPLEKETATHSGVLARKTPWTEEPGGHSPWGLKELDTTEPLNMHTRTIAPITGYSDADFPRVPPGS